MLKTNRKRKTAQRRVSRLDQIKNQLQRYALRFTAGAFLVWCLAWFALSGAALRSAVWAEDQFIKLSASAGFTIENIYVDGRVNTDKDLMFALIGADKGMPLLAVDPHEIHDALSSISWIKDVHVKRVYPDSLSISLYEREPFALLYNQKRLSLIDPAGAVITSQDLERFKDLTILRGEGAAENAASFMGILNAHPELMERIDQLHFVGKRRWDLILKNKIRVNLPEDGFPLALERLMRAHQKDELLDKNIKNIDIRFTDRLIIETYPGAVQEYNLTSANGKTI